MATVRLISDKEAPAAARAVFDDIRKTRGSDFINDFWRGLANDPATLEQVWSEVKTVMAPGNLDTLTKEMIYIAVSVANACTYCIHSHTASARAKGMSEEQHGELLRVISLAAKTNHLVNAMQIEPDAVFKVGEKN
ncbi:MAG: carboxymuconolactone decarboxylase family protein [Salaquimonas sp.]|nr:carboxymuconolactone decarboxylase family protein [Salaquimonas sp.]